MNHKGHISLALLFGFVTAMMGFSFGNVGYIQKQYRIIIEPHQMFIFILIFLIFVYIGIEIGKNIYLKTEEIK